MCKPLETLLRRIERMDPKSVIYFVGDYVNRGKETRQAIDLILSLDQSRVRCIRGNHDDILDQILHGVAYAENAARGDRFVAFQWFLEHGLLETLQSYGVKGEQIGNIVTRRTRDHLDVIIDAIPIEHRMFLRSLPAFIDDDDLFVIHGKWPLKEKRSPRELLEAEIPDRALRLEVIWGRFADSELNRAKAWSKTGFFGHTPVPTYMGHETDYKPIIGAKMILLDTAAALSASGRLTAMCAETSEVIQADPTGKLVEPAAA
jgi:hypothetical protein